jgi:hypothetical protein
MNKIKLRLAAASVLAAALLVGCGGGGGGGGGTPAEDISQSTSDLLAFMNRLIAGTDETSDPIDINALTLAVDDTAEPAAF